MVAGSPKWNSLANFFIRLFGCLFIVCSSFLNVFYTEHLYKKYFRVGKISRNIWGMKVKRKEGGRENKNWGEQAEVDRWEDKNRTGDKNVAKR